MVGENEFELRSVAPELREYWGRRIQIPTMQILLCDQYDQSTQVIEVTQGVEPNQIITPDRSKSVKERTWILEQVQGSACVERYQIIDVFAAPPHHQSLQNTCFRQVVVAKRLIGDYAS